jgi:hypothetical protein
MGKPAAPNPKDSVRQRQVVKAAGWQSIYVNSVEVQFSPWDFAFKLGRIEEASETALRITEMSEVMMSPEHAKALLKLLATHVGLYEKVHGSILDIPITDSERGAGARDGAAIEH